MCASQGIFRVACTRVCIRVYGVLWSFSTGTPVWCNNCVCSVACLVIAHLLQISRSLEFSAAAAFSATAAPASLLLVDAAQQLLYTGSGMPLLVSQADGTAVGSLSVGGTVLAGSISGAFVELLVFAGNASTIVRVTRGPGPRMVMPAGQPLAEGLVQRRASHSRGRPMRSLSAGLSGRVQSQLFTIKDTVYLLQFAPRQVPACVCVCPCARGSCDRGAASDTRALLLTLLLRWDGMLCWDDLCWRRRKV